MKKMINIPEVNNLIFLLPVHVFTPLADVTVVCYKLNSQ